MASTVVSFMYTKTQRVLYVHTHTHTNIHIGTANIIATLIYTNTQQTALIGLYHAVIAAVSFASIVLLERHKRSKTVSFSSSSLA
jgi:hypothetical protein